MSNNHQVMYRVFACAAVVVLSSAAQADTIFVPRDFRTIQEAIDAAVDTDEIIVAPDTYFETINLLGKAIWLHSSDGAAVTTIDGTGFLHVVRCVSGEESDTVLDGFTITGGNANGPGGPPNFDGAGGGMSNIGTSPTVNNCIFDGNAAVGGGGGMANFEAACPTITNCKFTDNSMANVGGGMLNIDSSPTLTDCTFSGNSAATFGGGMQNESSDPTVTNCTFTENSVTGIGNGGGMYNFSSSPTVSNCTFDLNFAGLRGGGMLNRFSSPTVTNCVFTANTTDPGPDGRGGGGMGNAFSNPTVEDCTFTGNSALIAGGMENFVSSSTIINCQFIDNIARVGGFGGGGMLSSEDSITTITNCTFSGNTAGNNGGGMFTAVNSITTITNCTFTGNAAGILGGGIYTNDALGGHSETTVVNTITWDNNPDEIRDIAGATTTVNYSDVQGGWPGAGANNIDADPLFVDPGNRDLHLLPGSPCIDAGDNTAVPAGVTTDLDGNARFLDDPYVKDTGCGRAPIVDMGAYELCLWDCGGDYDGNVGIVDFLALLAQWNQVGTTCDFGLGPAGVGINEFLDLLANWGPCM